MLKKQKQAYLIILSIKINRELSKVTDYIYKETNE